MAPSEPVLTPREKLDAALKLLPSERDLSSHIPKEDKVYVTGGGFCDVYKGFSARHDCRVAIRRLRVHLHSDRYICTVRSLCCDLTTWKLLLTVLVASDLPEKYEYGVALIMLTYSHFLAMRY